MKKLFTAFLALALLASFAACSDKESSEEPTSEPLAGVININTPEAWQEKFPDKKICSFNVHYAEYETGEYEEIYYFAEGESLAEWAGEEFNLSGWFVSDDMLVSGSGQFGIKLSETLTDGCTLEAVKLETPAESPDMPA